MQTPRIKLLALLFLLPATSWAQVKNLRFSIGSEAVSLPTWKLVQLPIHPSITAGADLWQKQGNHWQQSLGPELTYYYHEHYEHALLLNGAWRLGYRFGFGLQLNFVANVGYKHSILTGPVYEFKDGSYTASHDTGKPQVNVQLGAGLQFPLGKKIAFSVENKYMVAAPYAPGLGLPFSLHNLFSAGIILHR